MFDEFNISVPFKLDELYGGFAECYGILAFDGKTLSIEYQAKDAFIGSFRSKVKTLSIPISKVRSFAHQKKWFKNSVIRIRVSSLSDLDKFPVDNRGEIVLKISRKDFDEARVFSSRFELSLAEYKLERL